MTKQLIIRNGRLIDPARAIDSIAEITIVDGKVASIALGQSKSAAKGIPPAQLSPSRRPSSPREREDEPTVIDATGLIVCPGLIDMHVHLREPGNEDEETIATGSAAAVAGGFTSICCMPNTSPTLDNEAAIEFVLRQAARANLCNVYPIGAVTKGRAGKELAEMGQMDRAGAVAFSDDGVGVESPAVMYRAMQYAAMFGKPIIQHCEDASLATGGCMHQGLTSTRLGLPGIPAMAEELMVQRDILIARNTEGRYHVAHISTAGAVQLVRDGKKSGVSVTTEVCPHHLLLTDESVSTFNTNYKMNPPLRARADVDACIAGVVDGTIDCLVTDHAPHGREEKELDFQSAPFGIIGLEMALGLFAKALIESGKMDWPAMIDRMTHRPAKILGLPKGRLAVGDDADVTLIDPNAEWVVDLSESKSKSRNCPYDGWTLRGRAVATIVGGEVKHITKAANELAGAGAA